MGVSYGGGRVCRRDLMPAVNNRVIAPTRLLAAVLASGLMLLSTSHAHGEDAPSLARCAAIEDDAARLRCFDELSQAATEPGVLPPPAASATPPAEAPSPMQERWELVQTSRRTRFTVKPHHPTYVLPVRYSDSPNNAPYRLLDPDGPSEVLDDIEAKFQLSLKLKAVDGLFGNQGDVWIGYTQQSHWQVYNKEISSPFREPNYEPELMLVFRTPYELPGPQGRFVNLGLVHQSNGRSDPLSRSWNRIYLQAGLERGNFALLARVWQRLEEDPEDDNNPDIEDFTGTSDMLASYQHGTNRWTALVRHNFDTGHGAVELDWAFPVTAKLKGYVQLFDGYGESLIDYDHRQTTIGAGFLVTDWF